MPVDPLTLASRIASSGLNVQETRMRVLSENLANAQSTGNTPGADAYRRKTISFSWELDRATCSSNWLTCVRPTGLTKPISRPSSKPGNWYP